MRVKEGEEQAREYVRDNEGVRALGHTRDKFLYSYICSHYKVMLNVVFYMQRTQRIATHFLRR